MKKSEFLVEFVYSIKVTTNRKANLTKMSPYIYAKVPKAFPAIFQLE